MDTFNYGLPTTLSSFLRYLSEYLTAFRFFYKKSELANTQLKYLTVVSKNLVTINCCIIEPSVNAGDYWYNGKTLRFCTSNKPALNSEFKRSYNVIYKYEEAFESSLISINPDLKEITTTAKPSVTTTLKPEEYLKLSGGEMLGPIILFRPASDPREPIQKETFDNIISKLTVNQQKTETNLKNSNDRLDLINNNYSKIIVDILNRLRESETVIENQKTYISNLSDTIDNLSWRVQKLSVSKVYAHTQQTALNSWYINHKRASTTFICSVNNELGEVIIPDSIKIIDMDTVVISMLEPISGVAVLNFE